MSKLCIIVQTLVAAFILNVFTIAAQEVFSKEGNLNDEFLSYTIVSLDEFLEGDIIKNNTPFFEESKQWEVVDLYEEFVRLFDPENFNCGCDEQLIKKLKKIKPKNKKATGYVPRVVIENALYTDSAILFKYAGSNILAHSFTYEMNNGKHSKLLFARESISTKDFNESNYFEKDDEAYNNFLYTLDCSGFLSASVTAAGGIGKNAIESSAKAAIGADKSLLVVGGVMYSPLYQAFKGEGIYSYKDSNVVIQRINILSAILNEIPPENHIDTNRIIINSNYRVILMSNSGTTSFNGEANFGATGSVGFGAGSVSAAGNASGSVDRKSEFTRYNTYIINTNIGADIQKITFKSIKNKIKELDKVLANLK